MAIQRFNAVTFCNTFVPYQTIREEPSLYLIFAIFAAAVKLKQRRSCSETDRK